MGNVCCKNSEVTPEGTEPTDGDVLARSPQQQPSTDNLPLQTNGARELTPQDLAEGLIADGNIRPEMQHGDGGDHTIHETGFAPEASKYPETVPMKSKTDKSEKVIRTEKGFAAAEAIRSQWVSLTKLSFSQLGRRLFQKKLINDEDYEKAKNKSRNDNESEAMEHVLIVAKRSVESQPERFQDFCDALHSVDAHASEEVIAEYQKILRRKGLEAAVAIDSGTKQADASFDRDDTLGQEATAHPTKRICSSLSEDQYSPSASSDTHSEFTSEEQTTKCGKRNALHLATLRNETHTIRKILQDNERDGSSAYQIDDLSELGNSPLHIAARTGNTAIAQELLNHGASTRLQNIQKYRTPLHLACAYGSAKTVELLIKRDEQCLSMTDKNDDTPMHTACKRGSVPIARALLKSKKCDLYSQNLQRRTPLHLATHRGSDEQVRILLKYDDRPAFLSAQDEDGNNALHVASAKGSSNIIDILRKKDKNKTLRDAKNYDGQTPIEVASDDKSRRILKKRRKIKIPSKKSRKLKKSPSALSESVSTLSSVGSEKEKDILYSSQETVESP